MSRNTRAQRGQASVELAVASGLFVTIVMGGVALAEFTTVTLRVKQAAAYAMHAATGQRTHNFASLGPAAYAPFNPATAGAATTTAFEDLDPTRIVGAQSQLMMANASGFRATCAADGNAALNFGLPTPTTAPTAPAARAYLNGIYAPRGGVQCSTQARVSIIDTSGRPRIGTGTLDAKYGANRSVWNKFSFTVCGSGSAQSGACRGQLSVLTGDWAFDGPPGSRLNGDVARFHENGDFNNRPNSVINDNYRQIVQTVFARNGRGGGTSSNQALTFIGVNAARDEWINVNDFHMSYRGIDGANGPGSRGSPRQLLRETNAFNNQMRYQTSGVDVHDAFLGYRVSSNDLVGYYAPCFLGLAGCR